MQINNLTELQSAVAQLAEIKSREAELQAQSARVTREWEQAHRSMMVIDCDGSEVTLAQRYREIENAVLSYAAEHRAELLRGLRGKSREFDDGSITWRKQPDGVQVDSDRQFLEAIDARTCLVSAVQKLLRSIPLNGDGTLTVDDVVDVRFTPACERVTDAINRQVLSRDALSLAGMVWCQGQEKVSVKPRLRQITTESE